MYNNKNVKNRLLHIVLSKMSLNSPSNTNKFPGEITWTLIFLGAAPPRCHPGSNIPPISNSSLLLENTIIETHICFALLL